MIIEILEKSMDYCFSLIHRPRPSGANNQSALLIAHRGAHANKQGIFENTMEAFELAEKAGCWGIEFDIHQTKDMVFVVNHDPTLTRLWNQPASIAELTFDELRQLEPKVPMLSEVVSRFAGKMHLFIELKTPIQNEIILKESLKDLIPCQDFHLLSLDPEIFKTVSSFPKKSQLLVAVHNNMDTFCKMSLKEGFGGVLGSYVLLTKKRIRQLKDAKQHYGVGFIDSRNGLYRELNRGVSWLFTNKAGEVGSYIRDLQKE